jgi:sec-independent protein translocase protein TatA
MANIQMPTADSRRFGLLGGEFIVTQIKTIHLTSEPSGIILITGAFVNISKLWLVDEAVDWVVFYFRFRKKETVMIEHLQYLGFWTPGPLEIVIILVVALLLFGRRLPEIARNVGKSMTEFKKGINEAKETKDDVVSDLNKLKNEVAEETKEAAGLDELDD